MQLIINTVMLLIFGAIVSYCDIKYKKIFNWLTGSFLVIAVVTNYCFSGIRGLSFSVKGMILGFGILFLPYLSKWVGGGDVKLLTALGALVGAKIILYGTLYGLILGGIASFIILLKKGKLKTLFYYNLLYGQEIKSSGKIPLGVFLSTGVLLSWLLFSFIL